MAAFNLNKTPIGETGCLSNPYFLLTGCLGIQFFAYPSLCSTCVTYRAPCHAAGHQVLPNQPLPREAEDFPRGNNHPKHVPLLTYLVSLQPII